jgi:hypothetical protein
VPLPRTTGDTARVSVTIRKGGRTVARVSERLEVATVRPNEPNCPPVCRFIDARLDVRHRLLQPA